MAWQTRVYFYAIKTLISIDYRTIYVILDYPIIALKTLGFNQEFFEIGPWVAFVVELNSSHR